MTTRMLAAAVSLALFAAPPLATAAQPDAETMVVVKVHYDGAKDEEVLVQISGFGPSGTISVDPGEAPK